jgi:Zn-dependent protease
VFIEPGRTNYDLQFPLFGFPVRVHPAFFILPILLGQGFVRGSDVNTGVGLLLVAAVFFVSILIHELGHAVAFRLYGVPSRIVLYWMGGLAIPDSGGAWSPRRTGALTSNQQIVVSFAGPLFGFLLAALLVGIVLALGGEIRTVNIFYIPIPIPVLKGTIFAASASAFLVFVAGIILNILLNLLNLVPIYPLDGGQIARQVMVQMDRFNGVRNSIILSIASAILIAVLCIKADETFMAIFFGFMAFSNYQSLQQTGRPGW